MPAELDWTPAAGVNLVCGANGSGKTSVLEACAIAGLGRSFLTNNVQELVRNGQAGLMVAADARNPESGEGSRIVVRKRRGETTIELDGLPVLAASVLAQRLPLMTIHSKAPDILTDNPSNRRALLDRTMFHVEPKYVEGWKRYRLALRQRNELLRRRAPRRDFAFWHDELAASAAAVDTSRRQVAERINTFLTDLSLAAQFDTVSFHYSPGWNPDKRLDEQLEQQLERDYEAGFTTLGLHRADFTLKGDGKSLVRRLSRGQAKFLAIAIHVALALFVAERRGSKPVFLVDDLHAELDDKMCTRAVDMILAAAGQSIFTAIRPQDIPSAEVQGGQLFHVEQSSCLRHRLKSGDSNELRFQEHQSPQRTRCRSQTTRHVYRRHR